MSGGNTPQLKSNKFSQISIGYNKQPSINDNSGSSNEPSPNPFIKQSLILSPGLKTSMPDIRGSTPSHAKNVFQMRPMSSGGGIGGMFSPQEPADDMMKT